MSTPRKEPVIDTQCFDLTDRVKLTWRDVRLMAETPDTPPEVVQPQEVTQLGEATRMLTDEEKKAIARTLTPLIESAVRQALKDTLEVSLQNALSRVRVDIDRSINGLVTEAVTKELDKIDLNKLHSN